MMAFEANTKELPRRRELAKSFSKFGKFFGEWR